MELKDRHVAVIGMGTTGIATADFLVRRGADVTCFDQKLRRDIADSGRFPEGTKIIDGWDGSAVGDYGLVVMSPGVPMSLRGVVSARGRGVEVISEVELASRFTGKRIVAVTGTNGKTTTVTLLGQMLGNAGIKAGIGGNIGTPFIQLVRDDDRYDLYLLELSSYQLEGIVHLTPWIAGLLNITDDHLDRYESMDEYAKAKFRIFMNQTADDYAVINADDKNIVKNKRSIRAKPYCFTTGRRTRRGASYKDGLIVYADGCGGRSTFETENPSLRGMHNVQNVMMCVIMARLLDVPESVIQTTIAGFRGLPHRIELVADIGGVGYYDDSKATNVDAVVVALKSFSAPVILIMGGRDKGGDYGPLSRLIEEKVKLVLVMGEARERITASLEGLVDIVPVDSMESAVSAARRAAVKGDVVLLSPACSSFDMFRDYKHRGDVFKAAVERLKGGGGAHERL